MCENRRGLERYTNTGHVRWTHLQFVEKVVSNKVYLSKSCREQLRLSVSVRRKMVDIPVEIPQVHFLDKAVDRLSVVQRLSRQCSEPRRFRRCSSSTGPSTSLSWRRRDRHEINILVSSTGIFTIITSDHAKRMKANATVGNVGHLDMAGLSGLEGMKIDTNIPQRDRSVFTMV